MTSSRTRVMLVDDHAIVRSGFRRLLERYPDIEVVAEVDTEEQAYQSYIEHQPDITILDLSMPGTGGFEVMRRLHARDPKVRIVVFSMHEDASLAERAMQQGARGYVTKRSPPDVLAKAVFEVAAGRLFLSPDIAHAIAVFKLSDDNDPLKLLSPREFEIFQQLVAGRTVGGIAAALNLSVKTVANYHTHIWQKLRVETDVELVKIARRFNLVG
jgi:two-component system, NarL family, invasion response regulator UvrY